MGYGDANNGNGKQPLIAAGNKALASSRKKGSVKSEQGWSEVRDIMWTLQCCIRACNCILQLHSV